MAARKDEQHSQVLRNVKEADDILKNTTVHNHLDTRRYKGCKCRRFESCPDYNLSLKGQTPYVLSLLRQVVTLGYRNRFYLDYRPKYWQ